MIHTRESHDDHLNDPLKQYVHAVNGLHSKLAQISANSQDIAASLGRAASALRLLAASGRTQKNIPNFGKNIPNQEKSRSAIGIE